MSPGETICLIVSLVFWGRVKTWSAGRVLRWQSSFICLLLCLQEEGALPPKPPMQTAPVVEKLTPAAPKAEDKAVFPEGFETLAPEAKEVWLKAEVKPRIPKNSTDIPPPSRPTGCTCLWL